MKNKQTYFMRASFALLFFMLLGYIIKFYPDYLTALDSSIQTAIRGNLSNGTTLFYKAVTQFGGEVSVFIYTLLIALFFYFVKKWKAEAWFLVGNLALTGILSTAFKYLYNRSRPDITYLIEKPMGPSFPSWHTASSMIVALILVIIIQQRIQKKTTKRLLQCCLLAIAIMTAISRIYLGVHYPTDIVGGWLLAYAICTATFPYYDKKRFEWRFQSKQS